MNDQTVHNQVFLTKEGLKELKDELELLQTKKQPDLIERVARARGFGDLSENTEYSNAREELSFMEGRIEELEGLIVKAKLIQPKTKGARNDVVKLGCKVTVDVNGSQHTYEVVGEWEADPKAKKISHSSPLGKALLGKKPGEKVEIEAPVGKITYIIKKIH